MELQATLAVERGEAAAAERARQVLVADLAAARESLEVQTRLSKLAGSRAEASDAAALGEIEVRAPSLHQSEV